LNLIKTDRQEERLNEGKTKPLSTRRSPTGKRIKKKRRRKKEEERSKRNRGSRGGGLCVSIAESTRKPGKEKNGPKKVQSSQGKEFVAGGGEEKKSLPKKGKPGKAFPENRDNGEMRESNRGRKKQPKKGCNQKTSERTFGEIKSGFSLTEKPFLEGNEKEKAGTGMGTLGGDRGIKLGGKP